MDGQMNGGFLRLMSLLQQRTALRCSIPHLAAGTIVGSAFMGHSLQGLSAATCATPWAPPLIQTEDTPQHNQVPIPEVPTGKPTSTSMPPISWGRQCVERPRATSDATIPHLSPEI